MRFEVFPSGSAFRFMLAVLILVTVIVYLNTLGNGFVWDDHAIIVNNPLIRDIENIPSFFTSEDVLSPNDSTGYYRPISRMSYLFDYQLWGLDPRGYHLTNVILHALCAATLYLLVKLLFDRRIALVTGLLFALHPINVESVAWITGRNNVLVGLLIIASFMFYILFDREQSKMKRRLYFSLSLFSFVCALFTKEFAFLLPVLIALYHVCFETAREEGQKRGLAVRHLLRLIPYGILIGFFLFIKTMVLGSSGGGLSLAGLLTRLALSLKIFHTYIQVLLFPVGLKATYFIPDQETFFNLRGIVSIAGMAAVAIFAFMLYKRSKGLFFALAVTFLFLVPVSNIIAFSPVPVQERYAYIASMGFSLFLGILLFKFIEPHKKEVYVMLSLLIVFYAYQTVTRNADWRDDLTISLKTVEAMPDSPIAHDYLGNAYMRRKMLKPAISEFEKSAALNPRYPHSHYNLAVLYQEVGMQDEAVKEYLKTLALMPENADAHFNLALIYFKKGMFDEALTELQETVRLAPSDAEARNNLAFLYRKKGMTVEAKHEAAEVERLREKRGY